MIYQDQSPLDLTEYGEEMIKESGFYEIFEVEKDNLIENLKEYNPTTKYDVQEKARELMDNLKEYKPFEPLKTYAFENGKDFGQLLRAGSIPLRNYYLEKHPEITQ